MAKRIDLGGGRGLGRYGDPVRDTYNKTEVTVQDSSAAMYDACWLRLEGSAHLSSKPEPFVGMPEGIAEGAISAHLDLSRAKQIRDALDSWIKLVEDLDS